MLLSSQTGVVTLRSFCSFPVALHFTHANISHIHQQLVTTRKNGCEFVVVRALADVLSREGSLL